MKQCIIFFRFQRLGSIAQRALRIVVNFYHKSVCTGGDSGFCHRLYEPPFSSGMARINNYREMGLFMEDRDALEIQSISCVCFKGTDSALTEDDIFVSCSHDIIHSS